MSDLISRQAAIEALDQIFDRCEEIEAHLPEGDPDRTGYKMYPDYMTVWKYLHQSPSAHPLNPCETCLHKGKGWDEDPCDGCTGTESKYEPERKKGKWRRLPMACYGGGTVIEYQCPFCGEQFIMPSNYCQECGADMRGGDE